MSKPNLPPLPMLPASLPHLGKGDLERIRMWTTAYAEEAVRHALAAQVPVIDEQQPDGMRPDLDWLSGVNITDTVGSGWCARIDGTDIFDDVNRYGCKGRRSFQIAKGKASKQEATQSALEWLDRQRAALSKPETRDG